jgi:hypothetical protein
MCVFKGGDNKQRLPFARLPCVTPEQQEEEARQTDKRQGERMKILFIGLPFTFALNFLCAGFLFVLLCTLLEERRKKLFRGFRHCLGFPLRSQRTKMRRTE